MEVNKINRRILNNNIVKIEKNAFNSVRSSGKETVDFDIMSGIIVGDSEPLSREDIILCQKWEQHTDGTYKTLNLLRECIKPGTVIKSTLTIDETLCNIKRKIFWKQYSYSMNSIIRISRRNFREVTGENRIQYFWAVEAVLFPRQ